MTSDLGTRVWEHRNDRVEGGTTEIASNISNVAQAAKGTSEGATQTQVSVAELTKMAANLQAVVTRLKE